MIYLDYAASAPPFGEVSKLVCEVMQTAFANPASIHAAAAAPRRFLRESRQTIASLTGLPDSGICFTSGGTEANNIAIKMFPYPSGRRHIVVSAVEHSSVLNAARRMRSLGCEVSTVLPDSFGRIRPEALLPLMRRDTALVSVQAVNNETGTVQDIEAIAGIAHSYGALYHCDAVQGFGHIRLPYACADMLSASAHKFGGPRGVGFLALRDGIALRPLIDGGGQELGRRSGTENTPGIAGMALAAKLSFSSLDAEYERLSGLSALLLERLRFSVPSVELSSGTAERAPAILSLRFPGLSGEELLVRLSGMGICISAGSACASSDPSPSHVLTAMGIDEKTVRETVRVSVGRETTEEEMQAAAEAMIGIYRKVVEE